MSHRARKAFAGITLAVTALASAGCGESADDSSSDASADPDTLTLTFIPSEENMNLDESYSKVVEIIERETGKDVEFHQATSYAAAIEAQRAGKAQIAGYGPFSYVVAKDSGAEVEPIGYRADSPDDPGGYHSVASVRKDSDITELSGFKGKNICFVDPASTSGYLFPSAGLLEADIDPEQDITPVFAGGHDASVLALADGQCDGAFSTEGMAKEELISTGQLQEGDIKIIWESELIPSSPLAVSTTLSTELREQIKEIFLEMLNVDALKASGDCDESKENCGLPTSWGYLPVDDSVYDGIRAVCETTNADACKAGDE